MVSRVQRACILLCTLAAVTALGASGVFAAQKADSARPRCAFLDVSQAPVAALLEARLLQSKREDWVDRNAIDKVLAEQKLQLLFSSDAAGERAKLGKILQADVLVLLQSVQRNEDKLLQLVVCETRQGLRLCTQTVPATAEVAALEPLVAAALRKYRENPTEIWAVPPFLNQDLIPRHDNLKRAYSTLLEQVLLDHQGVVVVELAEAQAISRELALAGADNKVTRRLPSFLMGEFRNEGDGDARRVKITIQLERGGKVIDRAQEEALKPADAPAALKKTVTRFLKNHAATAAPGPDAGREAEQLAARTRQSFNLGEWEDALALAEASLLVDPSQDDMHHYAIRSLQGLGGLRSLRNANEEDRAIHGLELYRRGLDHAEAFVDLNRDFSKYVIPEGGNFYHTFQYATVYARTDPRQSPRVQQAVREFHEYRREVLRRILAKYGPKKHDTEFFLKFETDPVAVCAEIMKRCRAIAADAPNAKQQYAAILDQERQRLIDVSGEFFLRDLAGLNPAAAAAVADLRQKHRDDYLSKSKQPHTVDPPPTTVDSLRLREVKWTAIPEEEDPVVAIQGCVAAGPGIDVAWLGTSVYLMKKPGELRKIWSIEADDLEVDCVAFDGKYVWFQMHADDEDHFLLVLDPVRGTTVRVGRDDGLPMLDRKPGEPYFDPRLKSVPIGQGRAIVAGAFAKSWLALVEISDDGKKRVRVFHEARDFADDKKDNWKLTTIPFDPIYCHRLVGADKKPKVLVGRSGRADANFHPLVVDVETLSVSVCPHDLHNQLDPFTSLVHQGALYKVYSSLKFKLSLARMAPPEFEPTEVFPAPEGWLLAAGDDKLHIIGRQWWTADLKTKKIDTAIAKLPWRFMNSYGIEGETFDRRPYAPEEYRLYGIWPSHHHRLLISTHSNQKGWKTYDVEDAK